MNKNPKIRIKRVGILLAVNAVVFILAFIWFLQLFFRFQSMSWDHMFRTERIYHYCKMAFGALVFGILPGMAMICGGSAWVILKHLDKILDETPVA